MRRTDTFLFTDLEGSTSLWDGHAALMQALSARHDELMREAIAAHRGQVVKTTGDGFHAVFATATEGVAAALSAQQAILTEPWPAETGPLRVRMGLHTGESQPRDGDFYGSEVNRAARVMGLAHGGQILVSASTAALIRTALPQSVTLSDLGEHRLRGLAVSEYIYQLQHPALPASFPPLKSLSVVKHNLPVPLSTFVGREKELADVQRLLHETRLLTLLGPGGTGKTRLMLEVAEAMIGDFANGIWLVELAPLTDPDLIPERIAAALNAQEQPGRAMREALVDFLRRKQVLLLLDNVEHLVRESAAIAEYLLTRCPDLTILVTGREALFIAGETTLQIPSLSLPAGDDSSSLQAVGASESGQLFLARAQAVQPDFQLTAINAEAIAEIVRRLDGIPLALELAAARLRMLTPEQIVARLNDRFRLLTGGRRTALPRQQTLQALIDWSWNLLDEKEQLLLQRLSVFSGGWSLEAAQTVTRDNRLDEYDVFDLMEQLVNKSLVTVSHPDQGDARYDMLESIRQYSRDRLFESGEGEALRDRHAAYFAAFAEEAAPHLLASTMVPWVARITQELDNLRTVLAWTTDHRPDIALRIVGNLLYTEAHWLPPAESLSWLQPAVENARAMLEQEGTKIRTADFVRALIGLGVTHLWRGNTAAGYPALEEGVSLARSSVDERLFVYAVSMKHAARSFTTPLTELQDLEEAIEIGRRKGFKLELMFALGAYGVSLNVVGQPELGERYLDESLDVARSIDNPVMSAGVYRIQGMRALMRGDLDNAVRYTSMALEGYMALNDARRITATRSDLGHMLRNRGQLGEAEEIYRETIIRWQELGQPSAIAHQIECFALLAIAHGWFEHAARLLGAAVEARVRLNALRAGPHENAEITVATAALAKAMGESVRDAALAEGRRLSLDEAVEMALNGLDLPRSHNAPERLMG